MSVLDINVEHYRTGWEFLRAREAGHIVREGTVGKTAEVQSYLRVGNVSHLTATMV